MTPILWLPAASDRFTPGRFTTIDQLLFHTTVSSWAGAIATFQSGSRLVSAHYVVDELEDRIASCVRETDTAWHAGNWPVNTRSIGLEHVDNGGYDEPRDPEIYVRSAWLVADIARRRPQIPLVLVTDPDRPGCMRHRTATSTHCPGTLDIELIIGMARGVTGVFDPRTNAADLAWFDQRVRELVMGEQIAVYAVALALGRVTGLLPKTTQRLLAQRRRELAALRSPAAPKASTTKRAPRMRAASVRRGHGRG